MTLTYHENKLCNLPVGVLIGIDFYHSFFSVKSVKSKSGVTASELTLGWVLSAVLKSENNEVDSQHCFETHTLLAEVLDNKNFHLANSLNRFWIIKQCVINKFTDDITRDGHQKYHKIAFQARS